MPRPNPPQDDAPRTETPPPADLGRTSRHQRQLAETAQENESGNEDPGSELTETPPSPRRRD